MVRREAMMTIGRCKTLESDQAEVGFGNKRHQSDFDAVSLRVTPFGRLFIDACVKNVKEE